MKNGITQSVLTSRINYRNNVIQHKEIFPRNEKIYIGRSISSVGVISPNKLVKQEVFASYIASLEVNEYTQTTFFVLNNAVAKLMLIEGKYLVDIYPLERFKDTQGITYIPLYKNYHFLKKRKKISIYVEYIASPQYKTELLSYSTSMKEGVLRENSVCNYYTEHCCIEVAEILCFQRKNSDLGIYCSVTGTRSIVINSDVSKSNALLELGVISEFRDTNCFNIQYDVKTVLSFNKN